MSRVRARSKLAILCLSIYAARGFDFATYFEKQAQDRGHGILREKLQQLLCRAPPSPSGAVSDSLCDFPTVNRANDDFFLPLFRNLTHTTFFKYFRVNLEKGCQFWEEDGMCSVRDCSVCECDPEEVPPVWQQQDESNAVSALPGGIWGSAQQSSCVEQRRVEAWLNDESDQLEMDLLGEALGQVDRSEVADGHAIEEILASQYVLESNWVDDDIRDPKATYINLLQNPERFTGYKGESARRIWYHIYAENCFEGASSPDSCLEKRVFFRIISGLQSSITAHIAQEFLYEDTGKWGTNVDLLTNGVLRHKDRTENLYFLYLFLLRAITKGGPDLLAHNYTTGNIEDDRFTRSLMTTLVAASGDEASEISSSLASADVPRCCHGFDETAMFAGWGSDLATDDKHRDQDWWEERSENMKLKVQLQQKFQNISRIMDCVGCEKCRLWGKLQVLGVGTALKILFSEGDVQLHRNEVIALINVAHQVSKSVAFVQAARDIEIEEKLEMVRGENSGNLLVVVTVLVIILAIAAGILRDRRNKQLRKQRVHREQ
uniref:Uncharacterized protein n=1 Tax=Pinguiococcus pyrenoidosus TaxID=172671 RepID=A0A7R9U445_9STRA|mmetsp:Transcript_1415/g.6184  ORF Transcript_1415/g.6184 Transcript_1415/m.6184 type:complete len:547 (+) Transcript_1415:79-1719(+)